MINNQRFSKFFLESITNSKSLIEDIYNLSKFGVITQISKNHDNPVFEMHDMIAESLRNIASEMQNKQLLEDMINVFTANIPKSLNDSHLFVMQENCAESIKAMHFYSELYKLDLHSIMCIKYIMMIHDQSLGNTKTSLILSEWLLDNDERNNFKLFWMNDAQKSVYAKYLGDAGTFYAWGKSDVNSGIKYMEKAIDILQTIKGHDPIIYVIRHRLAVHLRSIVNLVLAKRELELMKAMVSQNKISNADLDLLYLVQAYMEYYAGNYEQAIFLATKADNISIQNGLKEEDMMFSSSYILQSDCFYFINQYQKALDIAQKVFNMYETVCQQKDDKYFGFILSRISHTESGLGRFSEASYHADQAIKILTDDKMRNPLSDINLSLDLDLAIACIARGDACLGLKKFSEAQKMYILADRIYSNVCGFDKYKFDCVSYNLTRLAEASERLNEVHIVLEIHKQHSSYYGHNHPRTIQISNLTQKN